MSYEAPITKADGFFIGEDKRLVFDVVDQNSPVLAPQDITGWTIVFEMSDLYSGDSIIFIAADLVTPLTGICNVDIPSADTIDLQGDKDYWYVLRHVDAGDEEELSFGKCYLRDVWVNYP